MWIKHIEYDDEVMVYEKRPGNEPIVINKYKKGDLLKILIQEKPGIELYNRVDVLHVTLDNMIDIYSDTIKVWRIHISFSNGNIMGGGSEIIADLDQKIRDIKLSNLLNQ